MSVVIVTKKCYLICDRINHITLQEEVLEISRNGQSRVFADFITYWQIHIDFKPLPGVNIHGNSRDEESSVIIKIGDKEKAYLLFSEIVNQIREQIPDQLFLDKLAASFLTEGALDESSIERRYEEVLAARKAKKRSKKVLRRPKKRNRRGR